MKSAILRLAIFLLMWWALLLPVPASLSDRGTQETAAIQHEVTVTLKLVQVYVTDKKGNPVLDLEKDDFRLFDNGKRQVITEFEKHALRRASETDATKNQALPVSSPLPAPDLMPRRFFLFFDFAYNSPRGLRKAKEVALHFIDSQLLASDEVGVLSYSGMENLELWEYLTTDHKKVREVIEAFGLKKLSGRVENLQEKYYQAVTGQNPPTAEERGRPTLKGPERSLPDMGAKPNLDATPELALLKFAERGELHAVMFSDRLRDLALALRYIPGQKTIILLSSGVPYSLIYGIQAPYGDGRFGSFGNSLLRQRYEEMLQELTASNCTVYALDTEDAGASLRRDVRTMGVFTLQKMTSSTGGKYFGNINRYAEHIEKIQNLTGSYYVLGYSVDERWDGAYHKIKVEVDRPDCDVRAQRGYYNPKLFKHYSEVERMLHLVDLALNEEPTSQVPVRFPVERRPCPPNGKANLCLSAEWRADAMREIWRGKYEIVGIVFDENGNAVELKRKELAAGETPAEKDAPSFDFVLAPGTYECRVIVRNLETGQAAVGGLSVAIEKDER